MLKILNIICVSNCREIKPRGMTKDALKRNFTSCVCWINTVCRREDNKAILRKCRYEYDRKKTSRFVNAKYKDARLYWNLLKETAGIKSTSVPLSSFEQYFRAVNNPADRFYNPDEDVNVF